MSFLVLYSVAFAYIWALIEAPLPVPKDPFASGSVQFAPACLTSKSPALFTVLQPCPFSTLLDSL